MIFMLNKVIVDTNIFLLANNGLDFISELDKLFGKYNLYCFNKTENELKALINKEKGKNKFSAVFGLKLFEHLKKAKGLKIILSDNALYLDDAMILYLGKDNNYYVLTNDSELQTRVLKVGSKLIYPRQGKYLRIHGKEEV